MTLFLRSRSHIICDGSLSYIPVLYNRDRGFTLVHIDGLRRIIRQILIREFHLKDQFLCLDLCPIREGYRLSVRLCGNRHRRIRTVEDKIFKVDALYHLIVFGIRMDPGAFIQDPEIQTLIEIPAIGFREEILLRHSDRRSKFPIPDRGLYHISVMGIEQDTFLCIDIIHHA